MSKATYISKDHNFQDATTIYWFELDGETWGVSDCNGERKIIDCDGYPVNTDDAKNVHLKDALIITEEMEQDS